MTYLTGSPIENLIHRLTLLSKKPYPYQFDPDDPYDLGQKHAAEDMQLYMQELLYLYNVDVEADKAKKI